MIGDWAHPSGTQCGDSHIVVISVLHNVSPRHSSMYDFHPDVFHTSWLCTSAANGTTLIVLHRLLQVSDAHVGHKVPPILLPCLFQVSKASSALF